MKNINIGSCGIAEMMIDDSTLAVNVGSGSLQVFATPAMTMLMEKAACKCLENYLEDNETTVGTELNVKHISATPKGMMVSAKAVLTNINGREFVFEVTAEDECGAIGTGIHKRFLVYADKFLNKVNSKLNK